ncbi:MAG: pyridoxal phosphate-dependent aminotransferase [Bryobacterales bacterium]|nr:pyridoxal phosphate-dependent aminotransferase [Bryobacterales bacterium]
MSLSILAYSDAFSLRPVKAAVVSEISEATASSPVPAEERVNFHIGNPVQDPRLVELYSRIALGLGPRDVIAAGDLAAGLSAELGWDAEQRAKLEFLLDLIRKSAPYLPRGGFLKNKPGELIRLFGEWLTRQPELLAYDFGEKTGRREVILASGGIAESLRVFFHALASQLQHLPASIFSHGIRIPPHLRQFEALHFHPLPEDETAAAEMLGSSLARDGARPSFVLLGKILSEETRRVLRLLSRDYPLFIVEVNDAPNNLSLAREAKMMNRTLRFLTPAIFSPRLEGLSTVFIAGFEEFIRMIETVHFQLKGTPSAAEVELLTYLLKRGLPASDASPVAEETLYQESAAILPGIHQAAGAAIARIETRIARTANAQGARMVKRLSSAVERSAERLARTWGREPRASFVSDPLEGLGFQEILDELPAGQAELMGAFKAAFLRHHPEYRLEASAVVSGSARTALGLLGFHCGIREVVIPDLSWTYEHCFPSVTSVPLTPAFELDVERMAGAVDKKLLQDPGWRNYGAVVFNNPHNATGQVFSEPALRTLLRHFLERGIYVIDDLSYQNVAPARDLVGPMTLRQLAGNLERLGYISVEQANRLISVHSLSKTDCLAGARLALVEIRDQNLRERFEAINGAIAPNIGAILLAYLFYRQSAQRTNSYWKLRNVIFEERMSAIEKAAAGLPPERNPFGITIARPAGSMYPRMTLDRLPAGVSLDWIASGLARQGIGLIPLSTFAHTEEGFETGRKSFRLTLGGPDGADRLLTKTRRVLIDLNRLIAEEESHYNRRSLAISRGRDHPRLDRAAQERQWAAFSEAVSDSCREMIRQELKKPGTTSGWNADAASAAQFLSDRRQVYCTRLQDRLTLAHERLFAAEADDGRNLERLLEPEFRKDSLARRQTLFRQRLYDRTVHPTQMYSIQSELLWERAIDSIVAGKQTVGELAQPLARELAREFLGLNVAIDSRGEGNELLLDLGAVIAAEDFARFGSDAECRTFLSYWGDWDGSNRPSGQGHRLIATVLMENVARMGRLLRMLLDADPGLQVDAHLIEEVRRLPLANRRFRALFDQITDLTHQLERRYRGLLPFDVQPGALRKLGMKFHVARDPVVSLWEHNDRLERRMLELRRERRRTLEHYFGLNKSLRKCLCANLGELRKHVKNTELALAAAGYRDLLRRFAITPRIHQNLVTSPDPFAIDTTVHNIMEINEIAGRFGNPGMVLALQVSMSSDAEALISLDRKMRAKREEALRTGCPDLPSIWLVPLYEDVNVVQNAPAYLGKLWDYAVQSRRLNESAGSRFSEMVCEIFIAGSDLSQQVGQTAGLALYKKAKYEIVGWLAERDLVGQVRLKMGSGEPMQRQGGYYAPFSGRPAFILTPENEKTLGQCVEASAKRSANYATTPLMGLFASGDLRTFQSNLSERLRHLPAAELAQVLYHVAEAQRFSDNELRRAAEPLTETRLQFASRGLQELERLTLGLQDPLFDEFMKLSTENFRRILYGGEEDVVGIYLISYFIARAMPPLRDRPTVRPAPGASASRGHKVLERIAATIPFARYGSSLRAIAHNQAQTFVLGVNQLTTGLCRTLNSFARMRSAEGEGEGVLADRILPHLPVYEILQALRLYQDMELRWLGLMERGFPAGNSAFTVLREDVDSIRTTVPLFQKEVVRRHGVQVSEFFEGDRFMPRLLPTLRPDLAVLLQPDLFNTSVDALVSGIGGAVPQAWRKEVEGLLAVPETIRTWRERAWGLLREPVFTRASSFVELATALHSVAQRTPATEMALPGWMPKPPRDAATFLHGPAEDSLQQFLVAAFEYLSAIPRGSVELPTNVVRAMKEVKRLVRIEEPALSAREQDILRFYLLQIARAAGENG